jgi:hypothetical protein
MTAALHRPRPRGIVIAFATGRQLSLPLEIPAQIFSAAELRALARLRRAAAGLRRLADRLCSIPI